MSHLKPHLLEGAITMVSNLCPPRTRGGLVGLLIVHLLTPAIAVAQTDDRQAPSLQELVHVDPSKYRLLRDRMLASPARLARDNNADRAGAQPDAIELAAFILEQRRSAAERFAKWDSRTPRPNHAGLSWFFGEGPGPAGEAFLLEEMWRPSQPGRDRLAFREMCVLSSNGWTPEAPTALYRGLWTSQLNEYLQQAALLGIGADASAQGRQLVETILGSGTETPTAWRELLMQGLIRGNPPHAADVVLQTMPQLESGAQLFRQACDVLAMSNDAQVRERLHAIVADESRPAPRRMSAWEACTAAPRPGDDVAVRTLLGSESINELYKQRAIQSLGSYPAAQALPVLREVLGSSSRPSEVYYTSRTLAMMYSRGDAALAESKPADAALLNQVAARAELPEDVRRAARDAAQQLSAGGSQR